MEAERALVSLSFKFPNVENELQTIRELRIRYCVLEQFAHMKCVLSCTNCSAAKQIQANLCVYVCVCDENSPTE